jgi:hypothetical protein
MCHQFEQLHSLSLGQQWLGMSSVRSERGFSSQYDAKALCGGKPGI